MNSPLHRRQFLEASAATASLALGASPLLGADAAGGTVADETLVGRLYHSLTPGQKSKVCFDWDYQDESRGTLRTFTANNWQVTPQEIVGDFYTEEQQHLIRQVFESIIHPDWIERYDQQLEDDCGGFGYGQSIAIFGRPGDGKFELVLSGRHMTLRCDGNSAEHVAFGGPIFYGHAPQNREAANHFGNVFWHQALAANDLHTMLDGRQQKQAQVATTPREQKVGFRGAQGDFTGLPVTEMSSDQKEQMQKVLSTLVEPYRQSDQDEAMACLRSQGGLDACHLSFYTDHDIGNDKVWDNWRLEGPSFVWHYRGAPHVHVWVNIADSPDVKLNA